MKNVFFIRHGESEANASGIRDDGSARLTKKGQQQAKRAAARLAGLPIERIMSSSFVRARETAEIISLHLGLPVSTVSDLFIERRNPSIMIGSKIGDPSIEALWKTIGSHYHDPDWRHSDEENFADLLLRAKRSIDFLESLPESEIAVVSHGLFMKVIFAKVLLGDALDGRIFWDRFIPIKNAANTGIMHLQFTKNYHGSGMYWKLVSWNDHAHLT